MVNNFVLTCVQVFLISHQPPSLLFLKTTCIQTLTSNVYKNPLLTLPCLVNFFFTVCLLKGVVKTKIQSDESITRAEIILAERSQSIDLSMTGDDFDSKIM